MICQEIGYTQEYGHVNTENDVSTFELIPFWAKPIQCGIHTSERSPIRALLVPATELRMIYNMICNSTELLIEPTTTIQARIVDKVYIPSFSFIFPKTAKTSCWCMHTSSCYGIIGLEPWVAELLQPTSARMSVEVNGGTPNLDYGEATLWQLKGVSSVVEGPKNNLVGGLNPSEKY